MLGIEGPFVKKKKSILLLVVIATDPCCVLKYVWGKMHILTVNKSH